MPFDQSTAPLSPTPRTTVVRGKTRAVTDRALLIETLDAALICHLAVDVGHPLVVPTAFGYDLAGPDRDGSLYVHGSVASRTLTTAQGATISVAITSLDGLVAGRSAFHHSMNYRSAVVIGTARLVTDADEKQRALDAIVDHMIPGRSSTLRASTRKELAATSVIALALYDASVKVRAHGPGDEPADIEAGVWGGHIPIRYVADAVVTDADALAVASVIPPEVARRAASLAQIRGATAG